MLTSNENIKMTLLKWPIMIHYLVSILKFKKIEKISVLLWKNDKKKFSRRYSLFWYIESKIQI